MIPTAESTAPARDEMSQPGDTPTGYFSHYTRYTGTTPNNANEANELSSEKKMAQNVRQWLRQRVVRYVHAWLCCCFHMLSKVIHKGPMSPNVDRPFEMTTQRYGAE